MHKLKMAAAVGEGPGFGEVLVRSSRRLSEYPDTYNTTPGSSEYTTPGTGEGGLHQEERRQSRSRQPKFIPRASTDRKSRSRSGKSRSRSRSAQRLYNYQKLLKGKQGKGKRKDGKTLSSAAATFSRPKRASFQLTRYSTGKKCPCGCGETWSANVQIPRSETGHQRSSEVQDQSGLPEGTNLHKPNMSSRGGKARKTEKKAGRNIEKTENRGDEVDVVGSKESLSGRPRSGKVTKTTIQMSTIARWRERSPSPAPPREKAHQKRSKSETGVVDEPESASAKSSQNQTLGERRGRTDLSLKMPSASSESIERHAAAGSISDYQSSQESIGKPLSSGVKGGGRVRSGETRKREQGDNNDTKARGIMRKADAKAPWKNSSTQVDPKGNKHTAGDQKDMEVVKNYSGGSASGDSTAFVSKPKKPLPKYLQPTESTAAKKLGPPVFKVKDSNPNKQTSSRSSIVSQKKDGTDTKQKISPEDLPVEEGNTVCTEAKQTSAVLHKPPQGFARRGSLRVKKKSVAEKQTMLNEKQHLSCDDLNRKGVVYDSSGDKQKGLSAKRQSGDNKQPGKGNNLRESGSEKGKSRLEGKYEEVQAKSTWKDSIDSLQEFVELEKGTINDSLTDIQQTSTPNQKTRPSASMDLDISDVTPASPLTDIKSCDRKTENNRSDPTNHHSKPMRHKSPEKELKQIKADRSEERQGSDAAVRKDNQEGNNNIFPSAKNRSRETNNRNKSRGEDGDQKKDEETGILKEGHVSDQKPPRSPILSPKSHRKPHKITSPVTKRWDIDEIMSLTSSVSDLKDLAKANNTNRTTGTDVDTRQGEKNPPEHRHDRSQKGRQSTDDARDCSVSEEKLLSKACDRRNYVNHDGYDNGSDKPAYKAKAINITKRDENKDNVTRDKDRITRIMGIGVKQRLELLHERYGKSENNADSNIGGNDREKRDIVGRDGIGTKHYTRSWHGRRIDGNIHDIEPTNMVKDQSGSDSKSGTKLYGKYACDSTKSIDPTHDLHSRTENMQIRSNKSRLKQLDSNLKQDGLDDVFIGESHVKSGTTESSALGSEKEKKSGINVKSIEETSFVSGSGVVETVEKVNFSSLSEPSRAFTSEEDNNHASGGKEEQWKPEGRYESEKSLISDVHFAQPEVEEERWFLSASGQTVNEACSTRQHSSEHSPGERVKKGQVSSAFESEEQIIHPGSFSPGTPPSHQRIYLDDDLDFQESDTPYSPYKSVFHSGLFDIQSQREAIKKVIQDELSSSGRSTGDSSFGAHARSKSTASLETIPETETTNTVLGVGAGEGEEGPNPQIDPSGVDIPSLYSKGDLATLGLTPHSAALITEPHSVSKEQRDLYEDTPVSESCPKRTSALDPVIRNEQATHEKTNSNSGASLGENKHRKLDECSSIETDNSDRLGSHQEHDSQRCNHDDWLESTVEADDKYQHGTNIHRFKHEVSVQGQGSSINNNCKTSDRGLLLTDVPRSGHVDNEELIHHKYKEISSDKVKEDSDDLLLKQEAHASDSSHKEIIKVGNGHECSDEHIDTSSLRPDQEDSSRPKSIPSVRGKKEGEGDEQTFGSGSAKLGLDNEISEDGLNIDVPREPGSYVTTEQTTSDYHYHDNSNNLHYNYRRSSRESKKSDNGVKSHVLDAEPSEKSSSTHPGFESNDSVHKPEEKLAPNRSESDVTFPKRSGLEGEQSDLKGHNASSRPESERNSYEQILSTKEGNLAVREESEISQKRISSAPALSDGIKKQISAHLAAGVGDKQEESEACSVGFSPDRCDINTTGLLEADHNHHHNTNIGTGSPLGGGSGNKNNRKIVAHITDGEFSREAQPHSEEQLDRGGRGGVRGTVGEFGSQSGTHSDIGLISHAFSRARPTTGAEYGKNVFSDTTEDGRLDFEGVVGRDAEGGKGGALISSDEQQEPPSSQSSATESPSSSSSQFGHDPRKALRESWSRRSLRRKTGRKERTDNDTTDNGPSLKDILLPADVTKPIVEGSRESPVGPSNGDRDGGGDTRETRRGYIVELQEETGQERRNHHQHDILPSSINNSSTVLTTEVNKYNSIVTEPQELSQRETFSYIDPEHDNNVIQGETLYYLEQDRINQDTEDHLDHRLVIRNEDRDTDAIKYNSKTDTDIASLKSDNRGQNKRRTGDAVLTTVRQGSGGDNLNIHPPTLYDTHEYQPALHTETSRLEYELRFGHVLGSFNSLKPDYNERRPAYKKQSVLNDTFLGASEKTNGLSDGAYSAHQLGVRGRIQTESLKEHNISDSVLDAGALITGEHAHKKDTDFANDSSSSTHLSKRSGALYTSECNRGNDNNVPADDHPKLSNSELPKDNPDIPSTPGRKSLYERINKARRPRRHSNKESISDQLKNELLLGGNSGVNGKQTNDNSSLRDRTIYELVTEETSLPRDPIHRYKQHRSSSLGVTETLTDHTGLSRCNDPVTSDLTAANNPGNSPPVPPAIDSGSIQDTHDRGTFVKEDSVEGDLICEPPPSTPPEDKQQPVSIATNRPPANHSSGLDARQRRSPFTVEREEDGEEVYVQALPTQGPVPSWDLLHATSETGSELSVGAESGDRYWSRQREEDFEFEEDFEDSYSYCSEDPSEDMAWYGHHTGAPRSSSSENLLDVYRTGGLEMLTAGGGIGMRGRHADTWSEDGVSTSRQYHTVSAAPSRMERIKGSRTAPGSTLTGRSAAIHTPRRRWNRAGTSGDAASSSSLSATSYSSSTLPNTKSHRHEYSASSSYRPREPVSSRSYDYGRHRSSHEPSLSTYASSRLESNPRSFETQMSVDSALMPPPSLEYSSRSLGRSREPSRLTYNHSSFGGNEGDFEMPRSRSRSGSVEGKRSILDDDIFDVTPRSERAVFTPDNMSVASDRYSVTSESLHRDYRSADSLDHYSNEDLMGGRHSVNSMGRGGLGRSTDSLNSGLSHEELDTRLEPALIIEEIKVPPRTEATYSVAESENGSMMNIEAKGPTSVTPTYATYVTKPEPEMFIKSSFRKSNAADWFNFNGNSTAQKSEYEEAIPEGGPERELDDARISQSVGSYSFDSNHGETPVSYPDVGYTEHQNEQYGERYTADRYSPIRSSYSTRPLSSRSTSYEGRAKMGEDYVINPPDYQSVLEMRSSSSRSNGRDQIVDDRERIDSVEQRSTPDRFIEDDRFVSLSAHRQASIEEQSNAGFAETQSQYDRKEMIEEVNQYDTGGGKAICENNNDNSIKSNNTSVNNKSTGEASSDKNDGSVASRNSTVTTAKRTSPKREVKKDESSVVSEKKTTRNTSSRSSVSPEKQTNKATNKSSSGEEGVKFTKVSDLVSKHQQSEKRENIRKSSISSVSEDPSTPKSRRNSDARRKSVSEVKGTKSTDSSGSSPPGDNESGSGASRIKRKDPLPDFSQLRKQWAKLDQEVVSSKANKSSTDNTASSRSRVTKSPGRSTTYKAATASSTSKVVPSERKSSQSGQHGGSGTPASAFKKDSSPDLVAAQATPPAHLKSASNPKTPTTPNGKELPNSNGTPQKRGDRSSPPKKVIITPASQAPKPQPPKEEPKPQPSPSPVADPILPNLEKSGRDPGSRRDSVDSVGSAGSSSSAASRLSVLELAKSWENRAPSRPAPSAARKGGRSPWQKGQVSASGKASSTSASTTSTSRDTVPQWKRQLSQEKKARATPVSSPPTSPPVEKFEDIKLKPVDSKKPPLKKGNSQGSSLGSDEDADMSSRLGERTGRSRIVRESKPSFIIKPRRQFVDEGLTAKFKASFDGEPTPTISWDKDGEELTEGAKYRRFEKNDFHFLEISEVSADDKGSYTATITNPSGSAKCSADLEVFCKPQLKSRRKTAPKIEKELTDLTVEDGQTAKLSCVVKGNPDPTIAWYHDSRELKPSDDIKQAYIAGEASLTFTEVYPEDSGRYECIASNTIGEVKCSAKLSVNELKPKAEAPVIKTPLKDLRIEEGEPITLECSFTGVPEPKILWYKGSRQVQSSRDITIEGEHGSSILSVRESILRDAGMYKCTAQNEAGSADCRCQVIVEEPKPKIEAPKFTGELEDLTVKEGDRVLLKCTVTGLPEPTITWYKGARQIKASRDIALEYKDAVATLELQDAILRDGGQYRCSARNEAGVKDSRCQLTVDEVEPEPEPKPESPPPVPRSAPPTMPRKAETPSKTSSSTVTTTTTKSYKSQVTTEAKTPITSRYTSKFKRKDPEPEPEAPPPTPPTSAPPEESKVVAPSFVKRLKDTTVMDGDRVVMEVEVSGTEPIDIIWLHGDKEIKKNSTVYQLFSEGTTHRLVIPEVYPEDAGLYICEAWNDVGDDDATCKLTVQEEQVDEYEDMNNNATQSSYSSVSVSSKRSSSGKGDPDVQTSYKSSYSSSKTSNSNNASAKKGVSKPELIQAPEPLDAPRKSALNIKRILPEPKYDEEPEFLAKPILKPSTRPALEKQSEPEPEFLSKPMLKPSKRPMPRRTTDPEPEFLAKPILKPSTKPLPSKRYDPEPEFLAKPILKPSTKPLPGKIPDPEPEFLAKPVLKPSRKLPPEPKRRERPDFLSKSILKPSKRDTPATPPKPGSGSDQGDSSRESTLETRHTGRYARNYPEDADEEDEVEEAEELYRRKKKQNGIRTINDADSDELDDEFFPPEFMKKPKSVHVDEGNPAYFSCCILANPEPDVFWQKEGCTLEDGGRLKITQDGDVFTFEIPHTLATDAGRYVVLAENSEGIEKYSVSLMVKELENSEISDFRSLLKSRPQLKGLGAVSNSEAEQIDFRKVLTRHVKTKQRPKIARELEDVRVFEGHSAILTCKIVAVPEPRISWFHNKRKEIKESKFFKMTFEDSLARLYIAEVYPEDEGEYMVKALNEAGLASSACDLRVKPDYPIGDGAGSGSEVPPPITTLPPDHPPPDIPQQMEPPFIEDLSPEVVHLLVGGSFSLKVKYIADPPPEIKWFRGKKELRSGDRFSIDTNHETSSLTVSEVDVTDSGKYTVSVQNEFGCDTCNSSVTVEDRPNAPSGRPAASNISCNSLTLSWYGPSYDGGSVVTNYRVEVSKYEPLDWAVLTEDCKFTSFQVRGLEANTEYLFRVSASNKHGFGEPGKMSEVVVTMDTRSMAVKVGTPNQLDLSNENPLSPLLLSSPLSPDAYRAARDEMTFEPRHVTIDPDRNFHDHYSLGVEIGKGRFGNVYKCIERESKKVFAAKLIKVKASQREETRKEVEIMNHLHHPKLLLLWDAFESPKQIILVMEHVAGGELFERIINDDYYLTERECVHFMRQICDGVDFMHNKDILHLDLKPENVLCITPNSNEVKIIDFGLARNFDPKNRFKVMFGTPEFVAPEVVNYDHIDYATDMWSVGVICYILMSGLSPFLGNNDGETLSNVTSAQWDFEDDTFDDISEDAKAFITGLLNKNMKKRLSCGECLRHRWLAQDVKFMRAKRLSTEKHKRFMARRKWQSGEYVAEASSNTSIEDPSYSHIPEQEKTGNAIRALGRMASFQKALSGINLKPGTNSESTADSQSRHESMTSEVSEASSGITEQPAVVTPSRRRQRTRVENKASERDSGIEAPSPEGNTSDEEKERPTPRRERERERDRGEQKTYTSRSVASITLGSNSRRRPQVVNGTSKSSVEVRSSTTSSSSTTAQPSAPVLLKKMRDFEVYEGDSARFDVTVQGEPEPTVTWQKDGEDIKESRRYVMDIHDNGLCSLIIKHCREDDDATYSCQVSNSEGTTTCQADLYVETTGLS